MSTDRKRAEIATKGVVYRLPNMEAVRVQRDVEYRRTEAGALSMDIYYPQGDGKRGVVVFVTGGSDLGAERILGCKFKEMESYVSWGQLVAASGMVGITYSNHEPAGDVRALFEFLRKNGGALGIDVDRIGVWGCSGNGPLTLSVLVEHDFLKAGVLCYAYTLDTDGSTGVADALRKWGFVNGAAGKAVEDLRGNLPLLLVRAGRDELPALNAAMDAFVGKALGRNLPITVVNYAEGRHSFDVLQDCEDSHAVIRQILEFLRVRLAGMRC